MTICTCASGMYVDLLVLSLRCLVVYKEAPGQSDTDFVVRIN